MERLKSVFYSLISLTMSLCMLHVSAFENKGLSSLNLFSAVCCKSVMILYLITEVHVCVLGARHRVFCDINNMSVYTRWTYVEDGRFFDCLMLLSHVQSGAWSAKVPDDYI